MRFFFDRNRRDRSLSADDSSVMRGGYFCVAARFSDTVNQSVAVRGDSQRTISNWQRRISLPVTSRRR